MSDFFQNGVITTLHKLSPAMLDKLDALYRQALKEIG